MLPRLCHIGRAGKAEAAGAALERANFLGFNGIVVAAEPAGWQAEVHVLAEACASRDLELYVDADFSQWDLHAELVERHPDCFVIRREGHDEIVDPRALERGYGYALMRRCVDIRPVAEWCEAQLAEAIAAGVKGFLALHPGGPAAKLWQALIGSARTMANRELAIIADTTGVPRDDLGALAEAGFDFTMSSLPWWDGCSNWLIEEHDALARVAPVIAQVDSPAKLPPVSPAVREARLVVAAITGAGLLMPMGFADLADKAEAQLLSDQIRAVNALLDKRRNPPPHLFKPTGAGANVTVLLGMDYPDPGLASETFVAFVNPGTAVAVAPGPETRLALGEFDALRPVLDTGAPDLRLPPGGARLFHAKRSAAIRKMPEGGKAGAAAAAKRQRIVITNISPSVASGRFPARRIVGERVTVEADIFTDGHPLIAAELSWRAEDEPCWRRERMLAANNDRWRAEFDLHRGGRYQFVICTWLDIYGGFVRDMSRKRDAGQEIGLDVREGFDLLRTRRQRAKGAVAAALDKIIEAFDRLSQDDRTALLMAGVRIFRVDNPHTKPFPFWEWMIADVRSRHPNTIFLSGAFTRPKIMYHLAQLGFSQSYTYFIWRNTKRELTEYMTELTMPPASDFFNPHFFVNTPDINPYFLQTSGRAEFLIRAALATTLSGLWGMYSGYELCESDPLPGREEYNNSEKYEIRPRDWSAPGNIVAEITTLNHLRKSEPALQSHLGLTFYNAFNDQILYYGKTAPGHRDRILVAVCLDPHHSHEADFEAPLWEWGLADDGVLEVEDLLRGTRFLWHGKLQHMRIAPEAPYAIWRARPARES